MKKLFILALAMVFCFNVYAEPPDIQEPEKPENTTGIPDKVVNGCPTGGFLTDSMSCYDCHIKGSFKIREQEPYTEYNPPFRASVIDYNGEIAGYYWMVAIDSGGTQTAFEYFDRHPEIQTVILNVDSYGGSVFDMWGIVSTINEYKKRFRIITECRTTAFSAGLIVFLAADERLTSPNANYMWHEVSYWEFLAQKMPSKLEEEAETMRMWQDMANEFIAARCLLEKEDIDKEIRLKEWWFTGELALELGIATGVM